MIKIENIDHSHRSCVCAKVVVDYYLNGEIRTSWCFSVRQEIASKIISKLSSASGEVDDGTAGSKLNAFIRDLLSARWLTHQGYDVLADLEFFVDAQVGLSIDNNIAQLINGLGVYEPIGLFDLECYVAKRDQNSIEEATPQVLPQGTARRL